MTDTTLLENQPIAWEPTPDFIERAQLTKFMRQVGVSTWDELYQFSIRDAEKFTEEVLKFLDIKFDPPYEKLLDTSGGIEFPEWFLRNADTPVRNEGEARSSLSPQAAIADKSVRVPSAGLNITTMCLDRWQTEEMKDQPAIIFESEANCQHRGVLSKFVRYLGDQTAGDQQNCYSYTVTYAGLYDAVE